MVGRARAFVVVVVVGCGGSSSKPADGGLVADAAIDAPPPMLESGTWMIANIQRTPAATGTCWATLVHLDVASDHVTVGERRFDCDVDTTSISMLTFTVVGDQLMLQGMPVGTVSPQLLDVTLPMGAGTLRFAFDGATATYHESETALGVTTTFDGALSLMPDDRPIALPASVAGAEDVALTARVHCARLPDAVVTFAVAAPPASGTVTSFDATTGDLGYTGNANFNGADAIGFSVSDGVNPTSAATLAIQLSAVEDPPIVTGQSTPVVEDTPTAIALSASDPDGDTLTATIQRPPSHGAITIAGTTATYTPAQDYNGSDSFTYDVSDGQLSSGIATVSITVTPVNDPPVANAQTVDAIGSNRTSIALTATDVDNGGLTYAIASQPAHGTVTGSPPNVLYRATTGYLGDDAFTFTASDGMATSAAATVTVHVLAPDYATTTIATGYYADQYGVSEYTLLQTSSKLYYAATAGTVESAYTTDGTAGGTHAVLARPSGAYSDAFSTGKAFSVGAIDVIAFGLTGGNVQISSLVNGSVVATIANPDATTYNSGEVMIGRPSIGGSAAYLLVAWASSTGNYVAQIWSTDGTTGGTTLLYSLGPIAAAYKGLWDLGGNQFFFAGGDLMKMTGSTSAPALVTSLPASTTPIWGLPAAGRLFFEVDFKSGCSNFCDPYRELYRSDGTAAGSSVIATVDSGYISYGLYMPTAYNNKLYFAHDRELHSADPTATGFATVASYPSNAWNGTSLDELAALNGKLFFFNRDEPYPSPGYNYMAYASDGTSAGTLLVTHSNGSYPRTPVAFNGLTWWTLSDASLGYVLWRTDYTAAGTRLELDIPARTLLGTVNGRLIVNTGTTLVAVY